MKDRQKKTPEQRATEALGTAERVEARLADKLEAAVGAVGALRVELEAAQARLQYVGQHPDLPEAERERIAEMFTDELEDQPEDPDPGPPSTA